MSSHYKKQKVYLKKSKLEKKMRNINKYSMRGKTTRLKLTNLWPKGLHSRFPTELATERIVAFGYYLWKFITYWKHPTDWETTVIPHIHCLIANLIDLCTHITNPIKLYRHLEGLHGLIMECFATHSSSRGLCRVEENLWLEEI